MRREEVFLMQEKREMDEAIFYLFPPRCSHDIHVRDVALQIGVRHHDDGRQPQLPEEARLSLNCRAKIGLRFCEVDQPNFPTTVWLCGSRVSAAQPPPST